MSFVKMSEKVFWIGKVDDRKVPFHRLIYGERNNLQ